MTYHGLLDWRLALAYLKILYEPNYRVGLDGHFESTELQGWVQHAIRERDNFISYFDYEAVTWGILPGFRVAGRRYLVVHPLWDTWRKDGVLAEAVVAAGGKVEGYLNTFNLLRRPGACRQHIEEGRT